MKKLGKSAIHDKGFQFYLTLEIRFKIKELSNDIHTLEDCIKWHKESKNEDWYNSKTKLSIHSNIEGYMSFTEFTLNECNKLYKERKQQYDLLISMCESALDKAIENTNLDGSSQYFRPHIEDIERKYVIVDESEKDD